MNDMTQPQAQPPLTIGQPTEGGFFAGRFLLGGNAFALIVAPKFEGEFANVAWHPSRIDVPAALSFNDGLANTIAMAEAGSELAKRIRALKIGGHDDWYLPSRDELEILYRNLKPTSEENWCYRGDNPSSIPPGYPYSRTAPGMTPATPFRHGGAEAFEADWHWSSTQFAGYSYCAWYQYFTDGDAYIDSKDSQGRARAVRRVIINSVL